MMTEMALLDVSRSAAAEERCGRTGTDDACVENRQVLLARGEGSDGKGAAGLRAATHTPLWRRTG